MWLLLSKQMPHSRHCAGNCSMLCFHAWVRAAQRCHTRPRARARISAPRTLLCALNIGTRGGARPCARAISPELARHCSYTSVCSLCPTTTPRTCSHSALCRAGVRLACVTPALARVAVEAVVDLRVAAVKVLFAVRAAQTAWVTYARLGTVHTRSASDVCLAPSLRTVSHPIPWRV
jgi:hypothetical protein